jgi:hypothetical protein
MVYAVAKIYNFPHTICRNAAVTLCPSLSCSYPRTTFCRNAAFVLSLIVPSAAMQPSRYVPPCPVLTLVASTLCPSLSCSYPRSIPAAMQPLFCHSSYHLPQCSRHVMSLLVLFVPSYNLLPQCSHCSVTHRTICRNAAVTLCPSLSCSYPRSIFCRNVAIVLLLIDHLPQCSRHIMSLLVLFVPSFHLLPQCSLCSVTHRTICRNAAMSRSQCSFVYSDAVPRVCIWTCVDLFVVVWPLLCIGATKSKQSKLS